MTVDFTVYGVAQPAGSKKAFANRHTGRTVVVDDNRRSRPWKTDVAAEAARAMDGNELLDGPLALTLLFVIPRPKGHYGARGLRPTARAYPTVKPDTTKLVRAVEDALIGICFRDDAQIVRQVAHKQYGEPARCEIAITELEEGT